MEELRWEMVSNFADESGEDRDHVLQSQPILTLVRNRGDLAEGWYDPATKQKADTSTPTEKTATRPRDEPSGQRKPELAPSDSEDDEYGPSLPAQHPNTSRSGPAIPRLEDIQHRNGTFK